MPVSRITIALILLAGLVGPSEVSLAAEHAHRACLNKAEQREAIMTHQAVPLATALKLLRQRGRHAEVVRASLCRREDKLVYELTLLGRSGKVTRAMIDAATGEPLAGH